MSEPTAPSELAPVELPTDRPVWTTAELATRVLAAEAGARLCATDVCPGAVALVLRQLTRATDRPVVAISADASRAHQLVDDLSFVLGATGGPPGASPQLLLLLAGEASPYADVAPDRGAAHQRLAALTCLARGAHPRVLVLSAASLVRKMLPGATVREHSLLLETGREIDRDQLIERLATTGYVRAPLVEDPGTCAARGSLLDVWPPGEQQPVRVELDGDAIARMRHFDPEDQRSSSEVSTVWLPPACELIATDEGLASGRQRIREVCDAVNWPSSRTRELIDELSRRRLLFGSDGFLPAFATLAPVFELVADNALVVLDDPNAIADAVAAELRRARTDLAAKRDEPHFDLEDFYVGTAAVQRWLSEHTSLALTSSPVTGSEPNVDEYAPLRAWAVAAESTPSLATRDQGDLRKAVASARAAGGHRASLDPLVTRLEAWRDAGLRVVLTARGHSQAERLQLMLQNRSIAVRRPPAGLDLGRLLAHPARTVGSTDADHTATPLAPTDTTGVWVAIGALARGSVAPAEGLALITEEEIFGSRAHRRSAAAKPSTARRSRHALLADLRNLQVGEHVVHVEHGIGRYLGLTHRQVGGHVVDLLAVEYAGGDKLYLPVYRLNQVQKFRGANGAPKLDRLGGQTFARTKSRAAKRVRQLADQLLRLYAERKAAVGAATPAADDEYRAFEATFPYEETDDQLRAMAEVAVDLESTQPMDRLVCGDVGFGKTEIALRSAFRVAMSGRQVALLCPTTVLAQQHHLTFEERLGDYPVELAVLSRFQSKKEQTRIARGLRDGSIDIVVGTHRLLSKDVHFRRLGLLVVDEEQRFGVTAKERITALKTNIDVLTLTATPIPRTLQMAVAGVRDLSIITTPPADRRAIRTIVTRNDPKVLREAITRELERGGQVFFVYNRVAELEARAADIQGLVPSARIAMAHGQMSERALEQTMLAFVRGTYDVLCCTAIIENGLDIPRCNTIIVDRADRFGLAQLYQLRGRVGRSKVRAYCYLVVPPSNRFSDDARARIEALSRHSELGAGFQVAALDLDLRGAGDLLGAQQSGTVHSVGFEMFCHMLDEAVSELRGEPVEQDVQPELSFDTEALLPESYIADVGVRLSLYKRLASAVTADEVDQLASEMEDRFGEPPGEARRLVQLMSLKTELRRLKALACEATSSRVTLHLRDDAPLDGARLARLLQTRPGAYQLTPDMRLTRRSQPGESFASGLEAADRMLDELGTELRP